jgi:hypothetical protein
LPGGVVFVSAVHGQGRRSLGWTEPAQQLATAGRVVTLTG